MIDLVPPPTAQAAVQVVEIAWDEPARGAVPQSFDFGAGSQGPLRRLSQRGRRLRLRTVHDDNIDAESGWDPLFEALP